MSLTIFEKTPLSQALAQFPLAPTSPEINKHQWLLDLSGIEVISDIGGLRWWPRLACGLEWAVLSHVSKMHKEVPSGDSRNALVLYDGVVEVEEASTEPITEMDIWFAGWAENES